MTLHTAGSYIVGNDWHQKVETKKLIVLRNEARRRNNADRKITPEDARLDLSGVIALRCKFNDHKHFHVPVQ